MTRLHLESRSILPDSSGIVVKRKQLAEIPNSNGTYKTPNIDITVSGVSVNTSNNVVWSLSADATISVGDTSIAVHRKTSGRVDRIDLTATQSLVIDPNNKLSDSERIVIPKPEEKINLIQARVVATSAERERKRKEGRRLQREAEANKRRKRERSPYHWTGIRYIYTESWQKANHPDGKNHI